MPYSPYPDEYRPDRRKFNAATGRYEGETNCKKGNCWTPKPGYVKDPFTPQPVDRDAYYFEDKTDKPHINVHRGNMKSVESMLQFFALLGCITFILLVIKPHFQAEKKKFNDEFITTTK